MTPRRSLLVLALIPVMVGASIAAVMITSMSPRNSGIFISIEEPAVVGYESRIQLTVVWPSARETGLMFLSFGTSGFDVMPNAVEDDPWEMPNVWNLTGLDLRQ